MTHQGKVIKMNISNVANFNDVQKTVNQLSAIKLVFVIIARAGFILIQSGCVPTEQFYDLVLHNIVEFSISTASYGLLGSIFSFGNRTVNGAIGYGSYSTLPMDYVLYGYSVVIFGSAIITTCLSGRLHFLAYVTIAIVYSGITQPLLLHWIYSTNGWMKHATILNHTAILNDFGGGLSLNLTSGLISLIGLSFLGRRLIKLHDIDEYSLGSESPIITILGYILIIAGYVAISDLMTPTVVNGNYLILNLILAIAGGGIASIIVELFVRKLSFNFWLIMRLLQGSVIGLTFTASVINLTSPPITFMTSLMGGCIISFCSKLLFKLVILDYCNILTIFFLPGIWSPIIQVIIVAIGSPYKAPSDILLNFAWYTWCSILLIIFIGSIYAVLFSLLWCCGFLRNETERICHARSKNLLKYTTQCPLNHLIDAQQDDDILEPGLSGKTPNDAIHKNQQQTNLRHFRIKYSKSKKFSKQLHPQGNPSISGQKDHMRPNKNIYTVQSLVTPAGLSHPFSRGDRIGLSKSDNLQKTSKSEQLIRFNNRAKKKSHHELLKSPRFTNFKLKKKLKSAICSKTSTILTKPDHKPTHEEYDAKYNDGFVTIKLPNTDANVSD